MEKMDQQRRTIPISKYSFSIQTLSKQKLINLAAELEDLLKEIDYSFGEDSPLCEVRDCEYCGLHDWAINYGYSYHLSLCKCDYRGDNDHPPRKPRVYPYCPEYPDKPEKEIALVDFFKALQEAVKEES